ncbi:MAG: hypothetical protein WC587_01410 [Candidatus Paceibacterota bacterium]
MKQKQRLEQKTTMKQEFDMTDMQSVCIGADVKAQELIEKHKGNKGEIEKEILEMEVPKGVADIKDFNYREEIWGAAKWLISYYKPGLAT